VVEKVDGTICCVGFLKCAKTTYFLTKTIENRLTYMQKSFNIIKRL
jgi:hypothetical protein